MGTVLSLHINRMPNHQAMSLLQTVTKHFINNNFLLKTSLPVSTAYQISDVKNKENFNVNTNI